MYATQVEYKVFNFPKIFHPYKYWIYLFKTIQTFCQIKIYVYNIVKVIIIYHYRYNFIGIHLLNRLVKHNLYT